MKRSVTVIAAIATLALAAGCSSADTKNEYVDTVNEIQTNALDAFNQAANATPDTKQAMVNQLEAGEAALADAVIQLESVEVPEEAEAGHPDLVAGIDDLRKLFEKTAADVQAASGTDAFAAVSALASEGAVIGTQIDEAITQINNDLGAE